MKEELIPSEKEEFAEADSYLRKKDKFGFSCTKIGGKIKKLKNGERACVFIGDFEFSDETCYKSLGVPLLPNVCIFFEEDVAIVRNDPERYSEKTLQNHFEKYSDMIKEARHYDLIEFKDGRHLPVPIAFDISSPEFVFMIPFSNKFRTETFFESGYFKDVGNLSDEEIEEYEKSLEEKEKYFITDFKKWDYNDYEYIRDYIFPEKEIENLINFYLEKTPEKRKEVLLK